jgi:hypothetical protein
MVPLSLSLSPSHSVCSLFLPHDNAGDDGTTPHPWPGSVGNEPRLSLDFFAKRDMYPHFSTLPSEVGIRSLKIVVFLFPFAFAISLT